jgi:DNA-directed RNA polymerase alpha subunit
MSKKELIELVTVLEQCNVKWKAGLTLRFSCFVALRIRLGTAQQYTMLEISETLGSNVSTARNIQRRVIRKLRKLADEDKKKRQMLRLHLFFISPTLLNLLFGENINLVAVLIDCCRLPVDLLELSGRSCNRLNELNIQTVGEIVDAGKDLPLTEKIGEKTLEELFTSIITLHQKLLDDAELDKKRRRTLGFYLLFLSPTLLDLIFGKNINLVAALANCCCLSVDLLDVSPRTRNTLCRLKIQTIGEALESGEDLLAARNLGEKTLEELAVSIVILSQKLLDNTKLGGESVPA